MQNKIVIKEQHLADVLVIPEVLSAVPVLMTPKTILSQTEFDRPLIISPKVFVSFDLLLEYRDEIQNLKLAPIKSDEEHDKYNALDKTKLLEELKNNLSDCNMFLASNEFPYWLPEDCSQKLLWVKPDTKEEDVINFITRIIVLLTLKPTDIILFERPLNTKALLVKGTFPAMRHIHFWHKQQTT